MAEAELALAEIDAIAATAGPGPDRRRDGGADHRQGAGAGRGQTADRGQSPGGHALTARLTDGVAFPFLLLLVSGGHCQLLAVRGRRDFRLYGTTMDDAVGEAFDKTAKLLGLPYPGGPNVEAARQRRAMPNAMPCRARLLGRAAGADFSFSGLKTAVRQLVQTGRRGCR